MDFPSSTTNNEVPSQGEPFVIPSFGNISPPFMDTLSLHGLTIGLPIWLFSGLVTPNTLIVSNPNTPS